MNHNSKWETDVIVIGDGIAGLSAALELKKRNHVFIVTKSTFAKGGSTPLAQGGVACAMGSDDNPELHTQDTLRAGDGLSDRENVIILTKEGPRNIQKLLDIGTKFDRDADGNLYFGREAAHCRRRILHANGDSTGAELERSLSEFLKNDPDITLLDEWYATDLIVENNHVYGIYAQKDNHASKCILADAVVIATGGVGRLFQYTTNPCESIGDGLVMASRAHAQLADIEFVQFHPTALAGGLDPMPLLTEALRGEGAVLVDENNHRFMQSIHKDAELAPRDVVARGIWSIQQKGLQVFLDARCIGEKFPTRFPTVWSICQRAGYNPIHDLLPVSPAAHYHMGGIKVDANGRTTLKGLWACGEAASTGVHGANRLASNSLLEGLVFGTRVGEDINNTIHQKTSTLTIENPPLFNLYLTTNEKFDANRIRETMWKHVGLVRSNTGLEQALKVFDEIESAHPSPSIELRNILEASRLIAKAALKRRGSRGGHYRSDFPNHEDVPQHQFI